MKLKKYLAILLALVLCVGLLAACGGGGEEDTPDDSNETPETPDDSNTPDEGEEETPEQPAELSDETLRVAISTEPSNLVPVVAQVDNTAATIVRTMYEPVVYLDRSTGEIQPNSLCDVEVVDDTHIRLTIKEGVQFHNGDELTSADLLYLFEQGKLGTSASDRYFVYDAENTVAEDDHTVLLAMTQPWAQAIDMLSFIEFSVVCDSILEEAGGAGVTVQYLEGAGTGKYMFDEWRPGEYMRVVRNENYWDQNNMAYFAAIEFTFTPDGSARAMSAQAGDVDIAIGIDLASYAAYSADSSVKTNLSYSGNVQTLFMNCAEGNPCNDIRVREAIYWLIDPQSICSVATSGLGTLADTVISPYNAMWDGQEVEAKEVDIDRAKELLAEAGYADGLTLRMRAMETSAAIDMVMEQLRLGGIDVDLILAEPAVHFWQGLGIGDYDIYLSSQQGIYYSEPVRCCDGIAYGFGDVMGGAAYSSEEMHEIATRCLTTMDTDERKEAYSEFQEYFRENIVSMGLYTAPVMDIVAPNVEGVAIEAIGYISVQDVYFTA